MKLQNCFCRSIIGLWLLFFVSVAGIAQDSVESPEQFASRYDSVSKTGDGAELSKLMHPDALSRFREIVAPFFDVKSNDIGSTIFGVKTKTAFTELTSEQIFERFMLFVSKVPEVAEAMKTAQMSMIGHVKEGSDVAHLVYKVNVKVGDITVAKTGVMSLKRNGEKWLALLSGDYEGLAAALAKADEKPKQTSKPVRRKRN